MLGFWKQLLSQLRSWVNIFRPHGRYRSALSEMGGSEAGGVPLHFKAFAKHSLTATTRRRVITPSSIIINPCLFIVHTMTCPKFYVACLKPYLISSPRLRLRRWLRNRMRDSRSLRSTLLSEPTRVSLWARTRRGSKIVTGSPNNSSTT